MRAVCVCGTGGDKSNSFNISTTVAFVVASAGVKVIKHGNKSVTSNSGSTDLLNQMVGIFDPTKLKLVAKTIKDLGRRRAIVLHGANGMDEATLSGDNLIYELTEDGEIKNYTLNATDYGLKYAQNSDFKGGSPEENLAITLNILNGKDQSSRRDVVILNAGLSLYVAEKVDSIAEGIELASTLIDNGEALKKYHQMRGE